MDVNSRGKDMSVMSPRIFKFKGFFPAFTVLIFFITLWVFFAVLIPITGGGFGGTIACLGVAVFLLFLGGIFLVSKSDIVVDESRITRVLFGKTLQTVEWTDVQRIVVYPVRAAGVSRNVTAYNIFALSALGERKRSRKIYFNNQSTDLTELVSLINKIILERRIKVEHVSNGRTTVTNSL